MAPKRGMVVSVLTATVMLSIAALGTYALWSDTVAVTGNQFASGSMGLQILDPAAGDYTDGPVYAVWGASNIVPGQQCGTATVTVAQPIEDTLQGAYVRVTVVNTCTEPGMDKYIQITKMRWRNGGTHDVLATLANTNETPWIDLDDLENQLVADALDAPDLGGTGALTMSFTFNSNAPNLYQRQSIVADFTLTLEQ